MSAKLIYGTTIVPFEDLNKMGQHSDAVVFAECIENFQITRNGITQYFTKFRPVQVVSGELTLDFVIRHNKFRTDSYTQYILGDTEYHEERRYLLFLSEFPNDVYKPRLYSYGIFQELIIDDDSILVPLDYSEEVHIAPLSDGRKIQPLYNFKTNQFLNHLTNSIKGKIEYDSSPFIYTDKSKVQIRSAPAHCTYLFSDTLPHWPKFPTLPLPVWYQEDGVNNCSNIDDILQDAIDDMHSEYSGIHLALAGTHNYVSSCSLGTALDDDYVDWVRSELGGDRHVVIQFDDPCDEITNLSGCSGTLARGGILKVHTTHTEHGKLWRDAAIGSIITNNGLGACYCGTSYKRILIHEMTHALGFSHIAGTGTANMNPIGINPIMTKDIECLDYSYPEVANDCGAIESWTDLVLYTDMTIRASNRIEIDNVEIKNNAVLTLIAPEINLDDQTNVTHSGELITILEDQCN